MLNSIGLDNDGIEAFIEQQLPYLAGLGTAIIVSIAGTTHEEFVAAWPPGSTASPGVAALELNISCPNVSGGVDFGTDPAMCETGRGRRPRRVLAARPGQADAQRDRHRRRSPRRPRRAGPTRSR